MSSDLLLAYAEEVLRFKKALNLTSISDVRVFKKRFVDPSVALAQWVPETGRLLDVGSGMGVPGIPLLLLKPGLQGVLVERRKKRAEFLKHLVRLFNLDVEVYAADINDLPCLNVDVCVARAVTDVESLLTMFFPHVNSSALAVLPVPQSAKPLLNLLYWHFVEKSEVLAVERQQVQCYRFDMDGGVSRET